MQFNLPMLGIGRQCIVFDKRMYKCMSHLRKGGEYDQEVPPSHTSDQPKHPEEEAKNVNSHMTSRRQKRKKVSECDQEISQSHTADQPTAP